MPSPSDVLGRGEKKKTLVQARYRMDCLTCAKFT